MMFMASPPRVGGQGWLARAVVANRPRAVIGHLQNQGLLKRLINGFKNKTTLISSP